MQFKNLFGISLLLACTVPLGVLGGSGRISYYEDGPSSSQPPSCGKESIYMSEYYIALNYQQLDSDKKNLCGRCAKIVYKNKYLVGRIVDRCRGCGYGGLDISPSMFTHFESKSTGVFYTNWSYVSCDLYGKKGVCPDSACNISGSSGSGSGSGSSSKPKTTTTPKPKPTTTSAKPTTNAKPATNAKPVNPVNSTSSQNPITNTSTTVAGTNNGAIITPANNGITTSSAEANGNNNNVTTENKGEVDQAVTDNNGNDKTYIYPITGVLMVSSAAGVGLLYLSKGKNNEKFSLKNIKRSLTHGSSIRRNITRTFTRKRNEVLPTTNEAGNGNIENTTSIETNNPTEMDISENRITIN